jgi:hypothetical protein
MVSLVEIEFLARISGSSLNVECQTEIPFGDYLFTLSCQGLSFIAEWPEESPDYHIRLHPDMGEAVIDCIDGHVKFTGKIDEVSLFERGSQSFLLSIFQSHAPFAVSLRQRLFSYYKTVSLFLNKDLSDMVIDYLFG